jgi:hypothetical protein
MFAEIEQTIVERLRAKLPSTVHVDTESELSRVAELRQKAPAVWLIYDGFRLGDKIAPTGQVQQIVMEWFVVIAAKSAKGNGNPNAARDEASAMCVSVLEALLGFHLGRGQYLHLADAPGPTYDGGYCHVPLAFTNSATFKGQA